MAEKLTHKEHQARAMLMGKVYDWRDSTYCTFVKDGRLTELDMIDADTLEPVSNIEASARRIERETQYQRWRDMPDD